MDHGVPTRLALRDRGRLRYRVQRTAIATASLCRCENSDDDGRHRQAGANPAASRASRPAAFVSPSFRPAPHDWKKYNRSVGHRPSQPPIPEPGAPRYLAREMTGAGADKVNLAEKLALLDRPYNPGIVGYLNDYKLMVVKVQGEFVWHSHAETDDFFLVLSGRMTIQLRDRDVELEAGEMFVVPRGVEHCPKADEEAEVLLIEPRETVNTGDNEGERTVESREL